MGRVGGCELTEVVMLDGFGVVAEESGSRGSVSLSRGFGVWYFAGGEVEGDWSRMVEEQHRDQAGPQG